MPDRLYTTVGVHPTRCSEFDTEFPTPSEYIQNLKQEFDSNIDKIVALGEFGLDYERTKFCDVETQKKYVCRNFSFPVESSLCGDEF